MSVDRSSTRATSRAVAGIRRMLNRTGFDITRDHFRCRFVYALNQHGVDSVIDVGANTGQFGRALRRAGYRGRIHSVEPLADACALLRARAANDGAWTVERAAVSSEPGSVTMNVSANSVSSSILPMLDRHTQAAPSSRYVAMEEITATTVDRIMEAQGWHAASTLLKIDVQGYEKSVLEGAGKSLLSLAAVRTEMSLVPLYKGQALLPEIIEILESDGFGLWYVEPGFVEPATRRLLQLDGVFFRNLPEAGSA